MHGARETDVYRRSQSAEEQAEPTRHESPRILPSAVPARSTRQTGIARRRDARRLHVSPETAAQRAAAQRLQGMARRTGAQGIAREPRMQGDQLVAVSVAVA